MPPSPAQVPPAPSPQAHSPEFTRNPALLQPHCQAGCAPRLPLLAPASAAPRAHTRSHRGGGFIHGDLLEPSMAPTRGTVPRTPQLSLLGRPGLGMSGFGACSLGSSFWNNRKLATPPPFSVAPDNGCHWGKLLSPLSSSSGVCGGLGPGRTFSRGALPGVAVCYWLPCLSCWYTLCPWMACSSKGRFIPSTQVSTRAFTREPPSERHKSQGAPGISATLQVHPGRSPSARLVLSLTRRA